MFFLCCTLVVLLLSAHPATFPHMHYSKYPTNFIQNNNKIYKKINIQNLIFTI